MIRIALLLLLVLSACTGDVETPAVETAAPVETPTPAKTPAVPAAPIRTDRSSYVLTNGSQGPETTIVATLRAPADQTLYILNCNGASGLTMQRRSGEEWVYSWVISMAACMSPPIVVPPGGEHTGRLALHERAGAVPEPVGGRLVSGTYRMVWTGVLTSFDPNTEGFGPELPMEQRVSAPFTIQVP
ncbi:MAG TPA: hypothetical protein VF432_08780 [Thermoanaerobaculia bacterium]